MYRKSKARSKRKYDSRNIQHLSFNPNPTSRSTYSYSKTLNMKPKNNFFSKYLTLNHIIIPHMKEIINNNEEYKNKFSEMYGKSYINTLANEMYLIKKDAILRCRNEKKKKYTMRNGKEKNYNYNNLIECIDDIIVEYLNEKYI